jgi:hypothetical protein
MLGPLKMKKLKKIEKLLCFSEKFEGKNRNFSFPVGEKKSRLWPFISLVQKIGLKTRLFLL